MHKADIHGRRAAGILSAVLLWLAAAVAGAYGPVAGASIAYQPAASAGAADQPRHHSAPVSAERPFIVADWRVLKAAAGCDSSGGEPALPPGSFGVADRALQERPDAPAAVDGPRFFPHGYGARAPPSALS